MPRATLPTKNRRRAKWKKEQRSTIRSEARKRVDRQVTSKKSYLSSIGYRKRMPGIDKIDRFQRLWLPKQNVCNQQKYNFRSLQLARRKRQEGGQQAAEDGCRDNAEGYSVILFHHTKAIKKRPGKRVEIIGKDNCQPNTPKAKSGERVPFRRKPPLFQCFDKPIGIGHKRQNSVLQMSRMLPQQSRVIKRKRSRNVKKH